MLTLVSFLQLLEITHFRVLEKYLSAIIMQTVIKFKHMSLSE